MVAESLDQLLSPHDLDAERSVLEAVMVEPGRLTKATAILTPADFFRAAHGDIFAAMIAVAERTGDGIDAITVCAELTQRGLLDEAGGAAYIGSLMSGVPRGVNLPHYADIVLRHSITRRTLYDLRLAMFQIAREGASGDALDLVEVTAQRARHAADAVEDDDQLFVTAADTCQDQESVPMALEPYLPAGSIGSVVAKVKEGKTTIILEMVRCIRHGDGFAGFKAPPAHDRVLYATEQLRASFTKQLKDAGLATDLGVVVSYLSKWRGRPWSEVGPALIRKAGQEEASVIVIDTASRWFGFRADEENQSGGAEHVQVLQSFCDQGGTVLLARHGRTTGGNVSDAGRGSSAIDGAVDFILQLVQPGADSSVREIRAKGRFEMPETLAVRRRPNPHHPHSPEIDDGDEAPQPYLFEAVQPVATKSNSRERVRMALANGHQTKAALSKCLNLSPSTIDRALEELQGLGVVRDVGKIKNAVLFGLVEAGSTSPSQSLGDGGDEVHGG